MSPTLKYVWRILLQIRRPSKHISFSKFAGQIVKLVVEQVFKIPSATNNYSPDHLIYR